MHTKDKGFGKGLAMLYQISPLPPQDAANHEEALAGLGLPPISGSYSFGPVQVQYSLTIDEADLSNSSAQLQLRFLGYDVISTRIDKDHPEIKVDFTIGGQGLYAVILFDSAAQCIRLKGYYSLFMRCDFDVVLVSFA